MSARRPAASPRDTAVYCVANRPRGRVFVDHDQNARGRTLASLYSVRPRQPATVSTPVTWKEVSRGSLEDFRIDNVRARLARRCDLWRPLLRALGCFRLEMFL